MERDAKGGKQAAAHGFAASSQLTAMIGRMDTRVRPGPRAWAALRIDTSSTVVEGKPDTAIVAAARSQHASAIMIGTHGRRVVRTSPVPVIVVPEQAAPVVA